MLNTVKSIMLGAAWVLVTAGAAAAPINGDFEAGAVAPWTTFITANGSVGAPAAQLRQFDVDGDGVASAAMAMSVGYAVAPCSVPGFYCPLPTEGAGLRQTSVYAGGLTRFSADVAVHNGDQWGYVGQGGIFAVYFDGQLMDQVSIGDVHAGQSVRSALDFVADISAGSHTLEILVTRNYAVPALLAQYIDDISVAPAAVPEPGPIALLALAGLMFAGVRRSRKAPAA